jgi:hypothetical protein
MSPWYFCGGAGGDSSTQIWSSTTHVMSEALGADAMHVVLY